METPKVSIIDGGQMPVPQGTGVITENKLSTAFNVPRGIYTGDGRKLEIVLLAAVYAEMPEENQEWEHDCEKKETYLELGAMLDGCVNGHFAKALIDPVVRWLESADQHIKEKAEGQDQSVKIVEIFKP